MLFQIKGIFTAPDINNIHINNIISLIICKSTKHVEVRTSLAWIEPDTPTRLAWQHSLAKMRYQAKCKDDIESLNAWVSRRCSDSFCSGKPQFIWKALFYPKPDS